MNLTANQKKELLLKKNVVSIKIGHKITNSIDTGIEAIVVTVEQKVVLSELSLKDIIPTLINNIPTDVQVGKKIIKFKTRTEEWIPAPGGVSCGHPDISAGTLGMWVKRNGIWGILSNNHVLANLNKGKIGDLIYQPGSYDGGTEKNAKATLKVIQLIDLIGPSECPIANTLVNTANIIARLLGRETRIPKPVVTAKLNLVDCAWAETLDNKFVDPEILGSWQATRLKPNGEGEVRVDEQVIGSGRSSGLQFGHVSSIDATINVNMGDGLIAMFDDQIEVDTPGFCIPGDSGSCLVSIDNVIYGLRFAGNNERSYSNKYKHVKAALALDTIE